MKKINKNNFKETYDKVKNKLIMFFLTLMILPTQIYASSGSISTAEVSQATENIKNAVIKLAMPIRRNFSICKYCDNCTENDS